MSIMFNEICINEEMLPKYTHIDMDDSMWAFVCCEWPTELFSASLKQRQSV